MLNHKVVKKLGIMKECLMAKYINQNHQQFQKEVSRRARRNQ